MRWLLIGLVISVVALLAVAGAVVRHVRRARHLRPEDSTDTGSAEAAKLDATGTDTTGIDEQSKRD